MDEDRCENCWWGFGIGGSCCHPKNSNKLDSEIVKPCGWFEPKLEKKEPDAGDMYDAYQEQWN